MNYNNQSNKKLEIDDMNIKLHLNTSLDLGGISISEDLINRMLEAIKEPPTKSDKRKTSVEENHKKIIPWNRYTRGFAGVAAAILIVTVGYNLVKQMPLNQKKDVNYETTTSEPNPLMNSSQENMASTKEAADVDNSMNTDTTDTSVAMDGTAIEEATQFTITTETFAGTSALEDAAEAGEYATDTGTTAKEGGTFDGENSSEVTGATNIEQEADSCVAVDETTGTQKLESSLRSANQAVLYTFRDIFVPVPEQAECITISDDVNGISITLTEQEDIKGFYKIMDGHQFTGTDIDSITEPNYTVKMKSAELGALYTMLVGNNLTVRYTQGENRIESVYYAVEDTLFKQDLEEFFLEYSK